MFNAPNKKSTYIDSYDSPIIRPKILSYGPNLVIPLIAEGINRAKMPNKIRDKNRTKRERGIFPSAPLPESPANLGEL
ncbi:MAG: hypothetical protein B6I32_04185 [Desulfobacterium sp. 4572_20]|nr:MAG: hypothetical protein B6I32_04185 [Desulfobacterium sp. 4572_20]RLB21767.1 MAG: hypothetical protein DRG73_07955 [Deltaproteobacteria bacterium]